MASETGYIASLVILSLLCVGLLAGILYLEFGRKKSTDSADDGSTCITKDCALTASSLISAMDPTVNPCEDFYTFTCGNFIKTHPVKEDDISFTLDDAMFNSKINLQLQKLIEEWNSFGEPNVVFRLQEAYHVCINTTYQQQKEFAAFKNFTRNVLDWPLVTEKHWIGKHKFLGQYMAVFEEKGLPNPLVSIRVIYYEEKYIALLAPASFNSVWFSWQQGYAETTNVQKVLKHTRGLLIKVLHLLGNEDDDSINSQLREVFQLINYLQESSDDEDSGIDEDSSDEETIDHGYTEGNKHNEDVSDPDDEDSEELMTFNDLYRLTARKFHWVDILNRRMHKKTFGPMDKVHVENEAYFIRLGKAAKKFHKRAFVNLFGIEILLSGILNHAGPDVDRLINEYILETEKYEEETLFNKKIREKPRWRFCIDSVKDIFNLVLTRLFIQKYIEKDEKQSADKMIQLVQKVYRDNIKTSDWLDKETKNAAIRKADKIKRFVGYPDIIFDGPGLDKLYENVLPQVRSTHFENYVEFLAVTAQKDIRPADEAEAEMHSWKWSSSPLEVNAFYQPWTNTIWFPYAHLQLPYFQDNRLAAVNFAMMGSVIGHEVGHAFDKAGSTFDEDGRQRDWWTNRTKVIYQEKNKCFIDQYSAYCPQELQSEEKICIDGSQTVGEDLADNTGLRAAFMAYKLWVEEHGPEKRLPGLTEFTPEQIFFISFGYAWCENIQPDKWVRRYSADNHSPARFRIIGSVSNSQSFREHFNCPEGPMNRGRKSCTVW